MTLKANLAQMREFSAVILDGMLKAVTPMLHSSGECAYLPYGSLPAVNRLAVSGDTPPSSRLSCDVAMGYLAMWLTDGDRAKIDTAHRLLRHSLTRQAADGSYVFNYGQHETDQVDLGTVLDSYWYFLKLDTELPDDLRSSMEAATARAIDFLETMDQPEYPGVIRKRCADPAHPDARRSADYRTIDVINGNTLAVTAYCRAADILNRPQLRERANGFRGNLLESFSRHVHGWWAYVEKLADREMLSPETILYQAMMVLYLAPLWQKGDDELAALLTDAMKSCADTVRPDGSMDWTHEKNAGFCGTQLLMLPSAAVALAQSEICNFTESGLARVKFVADKLTDQAGGLLKNEAPPHSNGLIADELRQIWAISDLGLIIINSM